MKKFSKRILFALLTVAMVMAVCMPAMAKKKAPKYQNVDAIESIAVDYTKSNVFTLNGWYEKKLDSGRTVKMYFPEIAQCRAYFTVVAAPGNVTDYQAWADAQGYTKMIADRGEVLVLLTPPEGKVWGKCAAETEYVKEAMAFVNSGKNAAGVTLFTNYSTFYLVGYNGGCAPLEAWSAANPILVDSQVFISGKSAGKKTLNTIGSAIYDGTNTGGYDPGIADLDEFEKVLKKHGYAGKAITKAEVPVPTWFVNYKATSPSVAYWKSANDCATKNSGTKTDNVFWQKKNSDAFQTEFANAQTSAKHGISQVKFSSKKKNLAAKDLGAFLYQYSRYNVPFAYSNHLSERVDYTTIRVAAQKAAQKAKYLTKKQYVAYDAPVTSDLGATYEGYYVLARKSGKAGKGVVESGILAFSDDNNDGVMDAREYLMYIPDSAKGKKAPVVFQYPGMTQSVSVGFDSTQWWRVADQNGVIIVIMGEAYNNGVALSWKNSDMGTIAVKDVLKKQVDGKMAKIDWTRIYGSGHSLGSNQVQDYVHTHPEFFAAVASTSFGSRVSGGKYEAVPTMLVTGQSDLPFLMKDLWTSNDLKSWFDYLALADNLKVEVAERGNADEKLEGQRRTWTYTWNNKEEIPMVKWGQTFLREHNCHPSEVPMAWDFLKNYKMTSKGRYYTGKGKSQKINGMSKLLYDMDNVESIQSYTDGTIYGEGLVKVEVTYKRGVILDKLSPEDFILEDRGSANPAFGQIKIDKVEVKGQTATLIINQDTDATETNAFIYTGPDKEGSRSRNSYGVFCGTGAWYRDPEGTLYWGKEDTDEYKANTTGMGWQARECLELKLRHASEPAEDAECLADEKGHYNAASKWNENIDANFGPGRLVSFEEAGIEIPSTSADIPEIGDDFVKGHIYVPADYDESKSYPLVVTIQGQNISYWKLPDGSNNFGCSAMFDVSTTSWLDKDAIVVNICDRSSFGIDHKTGYDYVVDDCSVIKYMLDNYSIDPERIVLHGNSRSTMAASTIIKALAGNPYTTNQNAPEWGSAERDHKLDKEVFDFTIGTYLCNNGMAGGQGIWNDSDRAAIAKTGIRIWCFDSEQDFNNRDYLGWLIDEFKALGYSDEWIAENERISCYPSEIFAYWGESDHSVTRMNYWYFNDQLYYGPDLQVVNGEIVYNTKLQPGDTYTVKCRGVDRTEAGLNNKEGMVYTVYGDLFQDWALAEVGPADITDPLQEEVESIEATVVPNFYGHKVNKVEITFAEDVDAEALKAADFTVYDRGSANPQFGALNVCDVQIAGNVVTLMVDQGTDKTADRARNSFGVMNCAGWYMDSEGNLYCGKEESVDVLGNKINVNVANKTCQPRNLDLILCVGETPICNGIFSTDTKGNMLEDSVWLPTNITGGLEEIDLEMIDLGWVAPGYTQINEEGEGLVPVQVIWPENYDPNRVEPYPVIDYQCGGGVCYWELAAGENGSIAAANNLGCNTVYDNTMTEWHKAFPEAIIMSVNVHSTDTANAALEINTALEYAAENWNADITKIVGSGNSQGTIILSDAIRQRSDLWAGYVECNGNFGNMGPADLSTMDGTLANSSFAAWTEEEFNEMIKNEVAVWMFNGETDGANPAVAQDTYATLKNAHLANGKSEEWVYNNIHISGLQSWKFKQWGETDHSVTKVVAWNYVVNPYNDVYEGQPALAVGDTYKFTGAEANYANYPYTMDFEYTVYAESVSEWVKNLFAGAYAE